MTSFLYVDEAFAELTGIPGDLKQFGRDISERLFKCTGIPVGVGIARTKTLAKLANHTAKACRTSPAGWST